MCNCAAGNRIPMDRIRFLSDQRNQRKMLISELSVSTSNISAKKTETTATKKVSKRTVSATKPLEGIETVSNAISIRSRDVVYSELKTKKYNMMKLVEVPKAADRYNVSNAAAAAISTAALVDAGLVNKENMLLVCDRNKVQRARQMQRETQLNSISFDKIRAIYFDGKIDDTLVYENGKKKSVKEDHISFLQQPGSYFIGNKAIPNGTAVAHLNAMKEILEEKSILPEDIDAIGSDGTVVNTGHDGGAIRLFEMEYGKTVQWVQCMLHTNELPLRALIENLDGGFKSKNSLSGPIGKRLTRAIEELPIVEFNMISFSVPDINVEGLKTSSDQQYLLNICLAISKGCVPEKLASTTIGPLCKVRWATTASRILRLYVSEEHPSEVLETIVHYIMTVYAPSIFCIKYQSSIVYGPIHLAKMVQLSRCVPPLAREIINESIGRNAFFAHSEHVVLAMLNDENRSIRLDGWWKVLKARESANSDQIRKFRVPKIDFNCSSYLDLIDLENAVYTDPPILRKIFVSGDEIMFLASKKLLEHDFGTFLQDMPLHTQSVERCVKLTSSASKSVCGERSRNGYIANSLASRNLMPAFQSKKDYNIGGTLKNLSV